MTEPLSLESLSEIEVRSSRAMPGPWKSYIEGRDHQSGDSFIRTTAKDIYLTGASPDDQDFIANARQDIPALIQEIRRLQALLKQS
jgi:hypothetical protein